MPESMRESRPPSPVSLGGQAVNEGVMVRGPAAWAVAVRSPDGGILVRSHRLPPPGPGRRLPLVRGVLGLVDSFTIGLAAIRESTILSQPGDRPPGQGALRVAMVGAVLVNVALFVVLPSVVTGALISRGDRVAYGLVDGCLRVGIFVAGLAAVRWSPVGRRLFGWHGAEHKVIAAFEHGGGTAGAGGCDLLADAARRSPRHPRCGTNFLILVLVLVTLADALVGGRGPLSILERLALVPLVAAVGYEVLKLAGRPGASRLARALAAPGLALQYLTTAEPEPAQLPVAAAALRAVLAVPASGEGAALGGEPAPGPMPVAPSAPAPPDSG